MVIFGIPAVLDIPRSNVAARERVGWQPAQLSLLEDLEQPYGYED